MNNDLYNKLCDKLDIQASYFESVPYITTAKARSLIKEALGSMPIKEQPKRKPKNKSNTYHKTEDESNKMKMSGGSWTINLDRVNLPGYTMIRYTTKERIYSISVEDALKFGFNRVLRGENKLVVPITHWEIY